MSTTARSMLLCLVILMITQRGVSLGSEDYVDGQCIVSARPPKKPLGLEFCSSYNNKACCIPQLDKDIMEVFSKMTDLGITCSNSKHQIKITYMPIKEWMCLMCDPDEPRYRFLAKKGDAHLPGGQQEGDPNATTTKLKWRVCKTFLQGSDGMSGIWGRDGTMYDQCGILFENPCGDGKQVVWNPREKNGEGDVFATENSVLQGWDPFMCGDNLIIPSQEYRNEPEPAVAFLEKMKPTWFVGDVEFEFVISDDTRPDFDRAATPCFRGLQGASLQSSSGLLTLVVLSAVGLVLIF